MDEVILNSAEEDFKSFVDIVEPAKRTTKIDIPETPHRCTKCSKLFFNGNVGEDGKVTVKCSRCGAINVFTIHTPAQNIQDVVYRNRQDKRYR